MSVYGYARVSTLAQADHGQSLEVQDRNLRAFSVLQDLEISEIYVDRAVSGSRPLGERPAGAALLRALADGDTIIATRLDRMFRSALDALGMLELLRQRQIRLFLIDIGGDVTGDGIAKLVFTILSAVAEAERDRIRSRIRDVKRDQRRRGEHLGGCRPPFGFRVLPDGYLAPHDLEQKSLVLARFLRRDGWSLRQISEEMTRLGTPLSHHGVKWALKRPPLPLREGVE
jgi:putative DNA-invertase from lambdoid prophage Rac